MISPDGCYFCSGTCSCERDEVPYASDDDTEWEKNAPWAQKGAVVKERARAPWAQEGAVVKESASATG